MKKIKISRIYGSYEFPADFMLCCATNPCKCGFYPDRTKCRCTDRQVAAYIGKISKPLLDRIDICTEAGLLRYEELETKKRGETSAEIRVKIESARLIQLNRFKGLDIRYNSEMRKKHIDEFCKLEKADSEFLKKIYEKKDMSVRTLHKILKVARTIADIEKSENIKREHLAEALSYKGLEEKYWRR